MLYHHSHHYLHKMGFRKENEPEEEAEDLSVNRLASVNEEDQSQLSSPDLHSLITSPLMSEKKSPIRPSTWGSPWKQPSGDQMDSPSAQDSPDLQRLRTTFPTFFKIKTGNNEEEGSVGDKKRSE
jgi:hypothetical protein